MIRHEVFNEERTGYVEQKNLSDRHAAFSYESLCLRRPGRAGRYYRIGYGLNGVFRPGSESYRQEPGYRDRRRNGNHG